jgi:hypothetical protein
MPRGALTATLSVAAFTTVAAAHAAVPYQEPCAKPSTAKIELAPWAAVGGGLRTAKGELKGIGNLSLHAAATIPVARLLRAGLWGAPGTSDFASFDASGGARIELHSNDADDEYLRLFGVGGRWTLLGDLGGGHRFGREGNEGAFVVARIAVGFTARNRLYHLYGSTPCHCDSDPNVSNERVCRPSLGLVSGARPFVTVQHALDASRTEVTAGIEFELIGAGWWVGAAF